MVREEWKTITSSEVDTHSSAGSLNRTIDQELVTWTGQAHGSRYEALA